jgi:hypothetical protein
MSAKLAFNEPKFCASWAGRVLVQIAPEMESAMQKRYHLSFMLVTNNINISTFAYCQ